MTRLTVNGLFLLGDLLNLSLFLLLLLFIVLLTLFHSLLKNKARFPHHIFLFLPSGQVK